MVDWLQGQDVSCARCQQHPHIRQCLGCGSPPTREDDPARALWTMLGRDYISPLESARRGLPPYRQIGYGGILVDWPWCPLWFHRFSSSTIADVPTLTLIMRARRMRDAGALQGFISPPWTSGFLDLLDLADRLEGERSVQSMRKGVHDGAR